jgi:hypothetical protein
MIGSIITNITESPRELLEGLIFFMIGFAAAHVKIIRPAKQRHEELLERHDKHDEQLENKGGDL